MTSHVILDNKTKRAKVVPATSMEGLGMELLGHENAAICTAYAEGYNAALETHT